MGSNPTPSASSDESVSTATSGSRFDLDRPGYAPTHDTYGSVPTGDHFMFLHRRRSALGRSRSGGGEVTADSERQDPNDQDPARSARDEQIERDTAKADQANGEGDAANDTEARYGEDESPA